MDRDALRALQEPLKQRYRDEPEVALVTLTASGTLDDEITCSVRTGRALATAGPHPATGGDGLSLCDFRGTLAVDRDAPVGFTSVDLRFDLDAPGAEPEQLATLLKLTERYCVVLQTLRSAPPVAATLERAAPSRT